MTAAEPTVRFGRRSTRGLILGFSAPRVAVLAAAVAIGVSGLVIDNATGLLATALVWIPMAATAFVRISGRPVVEWAGTAAQFGSRKAAAQDEYRSSIPTRPRPAGNLALPGDAAALRFHVDEATGAVMVHDPHRQTLSATVAVSYPAFVLLDTDDRAQRVSRWGRVYASLAQSGTCASIQILEAAVPDPATGQVDWYANHGRHDGGWADGQYQVLLDQVRLAAGTHRTTITLSLDMRAAARAIKAAGRGVTGAAEVLRADMDSLADSLRQAGLGVQGWIGDRDLAAIVRGAYDPAIAVDPRTDPAANLAHAGPVAVSEHWDHLRHDSGYSTVLWISEWPRIDVSAEFLHSIVFTPGIRRTLSLIARPLPTDVALRQIRKEKTEAVADMAHKQKVGQITDLSDHQEYEDLIDRERSVVAGHTDVEFAGLVTVTAADLEALEAARAQVIRAAAQARPVRAPSASFHLCHAALGPGGVLMLQRRHKPEPVKWGIRSEPDPQSASPAPSPEPPSIAVPSTPSLSLDDGGRLHSGAGYVYPRASARRATKAARRVQVEHRRKLMAARKAEIAEERAQRREADYLPRAGEPGPCAGRSHSRLRIRPHRATSEVLAAAYPFLAEEGLGSEGALIGQDAWSGTAFCYDPWELYRRGVLTNPNMFLAGQIGRGKSTLAKALATRFIAFGRRVYVPGDPKGEWSVVTRAVGGQVIELGIGRQARLNPLDAGPRPAGVPDAAWQAQLTQRRMSLLAALATSTLDRPLRPTERTALDGALETACRNSDTPILPMVVDHLHQPVTSYAGSSAEQLAVDGREVAHALGRLVRGDLAGLFDGPSTVAFDTDLPMLSLDLSHISGSDQLLGLVMACASAWMEASLADPSGGQRLVVYDEAWRLLAHPSLLARMQAHWKLSRAWGLANLMIVHRLSDLEAVGDAGSEARGLAQGLLGDTATRILYNEPHDEAVAAGKVLGLTATQVRQLPDLSQGEGLWKVNQRAFVVRHICTPGELDLFDTSQRMLGIPS